MIHLKIIWFGKKKDDPFGQMLDIYKKRLQHYLKLEIKRFPASTPTEEAKLVLSGLDSRSYLIAWDSTGTSFSTEKFSTKIVEWEQTNRRNIVMVIGGSMGLTSEVLKHAHQTFSLSQMTFPHRLALVLVAEQLYRAYTIIRNEPYHHG